MQLDRTGFTRCPPLPADGLFVMTSEEEVQQAFTPFQIVHIPDLLKFRLKFHRLRPLQTVPL